jgi:hypothetical protein
MLSTLPVSLRMAAIPWSRVISELTLEVALDLFGDPDSSKGRCGSGKGRSRDSTSPRRYR